jgi:predicted ATPase
MANISFYISNTTGKYHEETLNVVVLKWDNWNDYSYYTAFGLDFINEHGQRIKIGSVRIAYFGQKQGYEQKLLSQHDRFEKLENNYFSLGTDDTYYENLNKLDEKIRKEILTRLNDIAYNDSIYQRAISEEVTKVSLLRYISEDVVTNQYRRMTNGGARLTDFNFSYQFPKGEVEIVPDTINFNVLAEHNPPTNIHVIIGRNGVGKSHLINTMIDSVLAGETDNTGIGKFYFPDKEKTETFSNLVCITFSAFDDFNFHEKAENSNIKYQYIGIKSMLETKENATAAALFTSSLGLIISTSKHSRWKNAIEILESDPIFKNENFQDLIEKYNSDNLMPIKQKFSRLSSGHKIVLLTITKLVEQLQEKSLVIFDEPETHLHPPLLSSFIRAVSTLLLNRNAVSIMTTHSPIVLQEVPRSCVLKFSRSGHFAKFEKLKIETFGENIGVLTNDIFGLEVTGSGFYNILNKTTDKFLNYEEAIDHLNGELGIEGRAILRSLILDKNN